jgi:hypothetical protein
MAKITLPAITSGYATTEQLNTALRSIEAEFQNKVLYRDNTSGEANQVEQDIDLNGYSILNAGAVEVNGVDLLQEMQDIYNEYLTITQRVTISTENPTGGSDGDIWFKVTT